MQGVEKQYDTGRGEKEDRLAHTKDDIKIEPQHQKQLNKVTKQSTFQKDDLKPKSDLESNNKFGAMLPLGEQPPII